MIWFRGRNSRITVPITGVRPMPPPRRTETDLAGFVLDHVQAHVGQPVATRSSLAPVMAILNLRGRNANSGCSVVPLTQGCVGTGSMISSGAIPASASVVVLRMQLPLVWMPCRFTDASRSITSADLLSGIQLNCTVLVQVVRDGRRIGR